VDICAADAGANDADQDVVRADLWDFDVSEPKTGFSPFLDESLHYPSDMLENPFRKIHRLWPPNKRRHPL
jgi:hypothetical protein